MKFACDLFAEMTQYFPASVSLSGPSQPIQAYLILSLDEMTCFQNKQTKNPKAEIPQIKFASSNYCYVKTVRKVVMASPFIHSYV